MRLFQFLILLAICSSLEGCKYEATEDLTKAIQLYEDEEYQAAIEPLSTILFNLPNSTSARWMRAKSYDYLGQDSSSKSDYRILISNKSTSCDTSILAANELVNIYQAQHNTDSSEKYARVILKLKASCEVKGSPIWFTYEILAKIALRKKELKKALILNDSSSLTGAPIQRTSSLKGRILFLQKKPEEAIAAYSSAIMASLNRRKPIAMDYRDRGDVYLQLGHFDSACADYQKALSLGNKLAQAKLDSFCLNH